MKKIKCRKCGKVYPFDDMICPVCGYDIRKDESLSSRDRKALGKFSDVDVSKLGKVSDDAMERWQSQTKEEREKEAWENHNNFGFMPNDGGQPRLNVPVKTMLLITFVMIAVVFLMKTMY